MKEGLGKSTPGLEKHAEALLKTSAEHFNHDLDESLNVNNNIGIEDKGNFIAASEHANDVSPSELSRTPKTRAAEPMPASFPPS